MKKMLKELKKYLLGDSIVKEVEKTKVERIVMLTINWLGRNGYLRHDGET